MDNEKATTSSFVLTLPMQCELLQSKYLDKVFRVAGNMYNNLVSDRLKELRQMENSCEWRFLQSIIVKTLEQQKQKATNNKDNDAKEILKLFYSKKKDLLSSHGFSEYAFQARIQKWRAHHKTLVGTHVAQKIASAVWSKFQDYFYGSGKEISFCP